MKKIVIQYSCIFVLMGKAAINVVFNVKKILCYNISIS